MAACISSSAHCALSGARVGLGGGASCSSSNSSSRSQLAMPSSSFCGDAAAPFLHAGISSPLRIRSRRSGAARRGSKAGVQVESVLADLAEENVVCSYTRSLPSHPRNRKNLVEDSKVSSFLWISRS